MMMAEHNQPRKAKKEEKVERLRRKIDVIQVETKGIVQQLELSRNKMESSKNRFSSRQLLPVELAVSSNKHQV